MLHNLTAAAQQDMTDALATLVNEYLAAGRALYAKGKAMQWEPTRTLHLQKAFSHKHGLALGVIRAAGRLGLPTADLWALMTDDWFETPESGPTEPEANQTARKAP